MRAEIIAKLAWYVPTIHCDAGAYFSKAHGLSLAQQQEISHYAMCHRNLSFGWDFVCYTHEYNGIFPAFLEEHDELLWRAYKYKQGFRDSTIAGALAIHSEGNAHTESGIRAQITAKDVDTIDYIAHAFNKSVDTAAAYEKLFYNVLDRKKDQAFMASIIYPETRVAEARDGYVANTGNTDLIQRAGYNHGKALVDHMLGLGDNPFRSFNAEMSAGEFDKLLLTNGIIYAMLGFMNQKDAMAIYNARASIQAGKMGKGDGAKDGTVIPIEETIKNDIVKVISIKSAGQARRLANMQN